MKLVCTCTQSYGARAIKEEHAFVPSTAVIESMANERNAAFRASQMQIIHRARAHAYRCTSKRGQAAQLCS